MTEIDNIKQQMKSSYWSDAATYGLILGLALSVVVSINAVWQLDLEAQYYTSIVQYIIMASMLTIFSKIRGTKYAEAGYSFSQCFSFIIATMLFTGIIMGVTTFVLQQYIAPDYYKQIIEQSRLQIESMGYAISKEQLESSLKMMENPSVMVFSAITNMVFYGGFIGLFISLIMRRRANYNSKQTTNGEL